MRSTTAEQWFNALSGWPAKNVQGNWYWLPPLRRYFRCWVSIPIWVRWLGSSPLPRTRWTSYFRQRLRNAFVISSIAISIGVFKTMLCSEYNFKSIQYARNPTTTVCLYFHNLKSSVCLHRDPELIQVHTAVFVFQRRGAIAAQQLPVTRSDNMLCINGMDDSMNFPWTNMSSTHAHVVDCTPSIHA